MDIDPMIENDGMTRRERQDLVGRGFIVDSLDGAIRDGEHGLKVVPGLLKRVCNEECWRARYIEVTKKNAEFDDFVAFVESPRPEGLGIDLDTLRKVCRDDVEALDIIDRETKRPAHLHAKRDVDIVHAIERPTGNSADRALRKLRTDAPELHRQVLDGTLSPHAAMVNAGFRRRTVSVPVDDPDKVAAFLVKHFDRDDIRKIADLALFQLE